MALTINGKRTGKAAQTEKAERLTELIMAGTTPQARAADTAAQQERIDNLMQACYDIEGETFITWWEDDKNVPALITRTDQLKLLGKRLARLRRSRRF